jgi:hypothetical protein
MEVTERNGQDRPGLGNNLMCTSSGFRTGSGGYAKDTVFRDLRDLAVAVDSLLHWEDCESVDRLVDMCFGKLKTPSCSFLYGRLWVPPKFQAAVQSSMLGSRPPMSWTARNTFISASPSASRFRSASSTSAT